MREVTFMGVIPNGRWTLLVALMAGACGGAEAPATPAAAPVETPAASVEAPGSADAAARFARSGEVR